MTTPLGGEIVDGNNQSSFMFNAPVEVESEKLTDWEKFKYIHKSRPHIYKKFIEISETMIERGFKQYSAYGIMHIVRFQVWETGVTMKPEEDYKISDHMTPFYTRLFLRDNPQHEGFFQKKAIRLQGFQEHWINQIP